MNPVISALKMINRYNGTVFEVPWESVRVPKPTIGDIVSFTSDSSARIDPPLRPIVYRVRTDIHWQDVVQNATKERQYLNGIITDNIKPFLTCVNRKLWIHCSAPRILEC